MDRTQVDFLDWPRQAVYARGRTDGLQQALDIVNRASDYLRTHPDTTLDVWDVLTRIITDIQIA